MPGEREVSVWLSQSCQSTRGRNYERGGGREGRGRMRDKNEIGKGREGGRREMGGTSETAAPPQPW